MKKQQQQNVQDQKQKLQGGLLDIVDGMAENIAEITKNLTEQQFLGKTKNQNQDYSNPEQGY